jgi:hypothetical protein
MEASNRRRILEMLGQGSITADEAEQLLAALADGTGTIAQSGGAAAAVMTSKAKPRYVRVVVENAGEGNAAANRVNIRVPMSLLRAGVRLASLIPDQARAKVQQAMDEHGMSFDLANLKPEMLDDLIDQLGELAVDVDSSDNKVRIFCE